MNIKSYTLLAFLLLLLSCNRRDRHKPVQKNGGKKVTRTESVDVERVIDNEYTKIALSLCESIEFKELEYTTKNTKIIGLDIQQPVNCFLFASEISCGFPAGSCGDDIQVIMKDSTGYHQVFSVCGFVYNSLSEINYGIKSFLYGTSDGYKIKASWNGKNSTRAFYRSITSITPVFAR